MDGFINDNTGESSRDDLFRRLKEETDVLRSENSEAAFRDIDRRDFVMGDYLPEAYEDYPLPISENATISQPTTVAFMFELLNITEGDRVLDVGSGSGWTTALIAHMVRAEGSVLGIEIDPELVEFGRSNLKKYNFQNAQIENASEVELYEESFDKILVSAELTDIPEQFVRALAEEGLLLAPIGGGLVLYRKQGERLLEEKSVEGFSFVPYQNNRAE